MNIRFNSDVWSGNMTKNSRDEIFPTIVSGVDTSFRSIKLLFRKELDVLKLILI